MTRTFAQKWLTHWRNWNYMLQRESRKGKLTTRTYVVSVDVEEGVSNDTIQEHLSDSLYWVEGVGEVDVYNCTELPDINDSNEVTDNSSN